jgi:hypothetical protein
VTYRPCGACGTLVPADTGCEHWRPGRSAKAADSAERRRVQRVDREAARRNAQVADRLQPRRRERSQEYRETENEKSRNRRAAERASAPPRPRRQTVSDAERVAEFARIMGRTYR